MGIEIKYFEPFTGLEVLGNECPNCIATYNAVRTIAQQLDIPFKHNALYDDDPTNPEYIAAGGIAYDVLPYTAVVENDIPIWTKAGNVTMQELYKAITGKEYSKCSEEWYYSQYSDECKGSEETDPYVSEWVNDVLNNPNRIQPIYYYIAIAIVTAIIGIFLYRSLKTA